MKNAALALALLCLPAPSFADESGIVLKEAAGKAQVTANCVMCHSLDYVIQNSVFLDQKGWTGTVDKMVNVMGAPILPEDAKAIIAYLVQNYGKAPPPAAATPPPP